MKRSPVTIEEIGWLAILSVNAREKRNKSLKVLREYPRECEAGGEDDCVYLFPRNGDDFARAPTLEEAVARAVITVKGGA